ncbi:MAG: FtsX-like permease family protein [Candidatus Marinimicrobia bacterium]|jgi:putative ABC transport system permease protein|nr:FtsX-like permease family protein [Candidatus Neomarinimicrobiota bacterium]MBT3632854.1 FtsX-like permease family protein [Candidatus Neomarinimicrobiota bacterium]MBT3681964.1 FtsX-like permease family protein [Candidatus Neomarinimicrobiota bacterium]MBT3759007.1 FtsX-like permease family protein [Candidatus Neomarinimicrobiota bacterium]MBT3895094.1 FtsX-like permease family protein [Candidatus Neomarinimicrobiota bacterium]
MIKNYIKIAYRNLTRNFSFSLINIIGLAIGMTACTVIFLFIQDEISFEEMHNDPSSIYRVLTIDKALGTNAQRVGITMPPLGPALPENFPEVKGAVRLTGGRQTLLKYGDNTGIFAENLRNADTNFFELFNYKLIEGNKETALLTPYSLILTESLAKNIFGEENAMGKTLSTGGDQDMIVTGIIEDLPHNTHLSFDALGSIETVRSIAISNQPEDSMRPIWLETWRMIAMPTYVRFNQNVDVTGFDEKFTAFTYEQGVGENFEITLQPLNNVHLYSTDIIFDSVQNKGDIKNIYIFSAIAFLILLIASVNYMNLSTARSVKRAKEVGLRKVVGSSRKQLVFQFLSESILITFISLIFAGLLIEGALIWVNSIREGVLSLNIIDNPTLLMSMIIMLIVVGVMSGLYPAFVLSKFSPSEVLKGEYKYGRRGNNLRKILVVSQFSLSIALVCLTLFVQKQMSFIQNKDLGYDREQVLLLDTFDNSMSEGLPHLRDELEKHSSIMSAAVSGNVPGRTFGRTGLQPEGSTEEDIWIWSILGVGYGTLPTLGMEIVEGRNFQSDRDTDSSNVVMINETAVNQLGWDNPLDKKIFFGDNDSTGSEIVGIVKDFHYLGLHQNIEPVVLYLIPEDQGGILTARIKQGNTQDALIYVEEKWHEVFPEHPFVYGFMDEEFDAMYRRDLTTTKIVNVFSAIAIFIACLGLFGLASHSTTQRIKEIGVRKVVGASTMNIIVLLVYDFIKWVAISNIIAWPLAWYFSNQWLESFAYRINVDILPFLIASILAMIIAVFTVLILTWRAASMNPSNALRYE